MSMCSPVITDKQSGRIITPSSLSPPLYLSLPLCLSLCDDSAVCWSVLLLVPRHIVYPLTRPCVQTPPPTHPQLSNHPLLSHLTSQSSHPLRADVSRVKLSALPLLAWRNSGPAEKRWVKWVAMVDVVAWVKAGHRLAVGWGQMYGIGSAMYSVNGFNPVAMVA